MLPRMLAIDLDGTLLPKEKVLTPRTIRTIRAVADAGTEVVLATGKALHLTEDYAAALSLTGPIIALDGCMVRGNEDEGVVSTTTLPEDVAASVMDRLAPLALSPFLVDAADRLVIHEDLADWEWFLAVYARERNLTADLLADARGAPVFLAFMGEPDVADEGEAAIRPLLGDDLMLFTYRFVHHDLGMVIVRPTVTKGDALEALAGRLDIPRAAVTAMGDWRNDVTMIDWAGTGVAMLQSCPEVMEVADVVLPTSCESDGVAEYLEELLG